MDVSEIASPAAGDQNLLAQPIGAFEHGHAASTLARFDRAHQPSRSASCNQCVEGMGHGRSHVEQAETGKSVFFQKPLLHVLLLQLIDLRRRHFSAIGSEFTVRLGANGNNLLIGSRSQ